MIRCQYKQLEKHGLNFVTQTCDDDTRYVLPTHTWHSAYGRSSGRCDTSAIPYKASIKSHKAVIG